MDEFPAVVERRQDVMAMYTMVTEIHHSQMRMDEKLSKHMTEETDELAKAITKLMGDAFPASDPGGHRRHHEAVIKQAEEKAVFWKEMRIAAAKWAGIGLIGILAGWAWAGFLKDIHK